MECPKCNFVNREGVKFCEECGENFDIICPDCKGKIPFGRKFCGECGFYLKPFKKILETKSHSETPIPEKTIKDIASIEGERRQVTVLFCDLTGYTAMCENLDPEDVKEITNQIFCETSKIVTHYDGFVEKYVGDAIMSIFGIPQAHEDDPIRAIKAASEIHQLVDLISLKVENTIGHPISMHSGINTGLVVTGEVNMERGTHGVAGDTVNLASRLSGLAKPGDILVGHNTYRQAREYFTFVQLKPTKIKGKAETVPVYRIRDVKEKVSRVCGLVTHGISSPLVGRDTEFVAIKDCVNRLSDGQGNILLVIGEAGLGKSRLMAEAYNHFNKAGNGTSLKWLEGRSLSYGQNISYWPFREILQQYAGINEDDSDIEAWQKLESRIKELFAADTSEILPYLASLLTLDLKGEYATQVKYMDGEAMGHLIFLTSRRFFEQLAQSQPVVLVFEDFHWADESSTLLLEHLVPLVSRAPILICVISRLDPGAQTTRLRNVAIKDFESRYTEIRLNSLSQTQSTQLLCNLLEIENVPHNVSKMIVQKAEGNPFYLEEIMRSLIDRQCIEHDASTGRWRATPHIETIIIPDTIQGMIMSRVDRLDEELKQLIRNASVIGRSFLYTILHSIEQTAQNLDCRLNALKEMELIREKQRIPELEYIFKHALVQESIYESILLQKRREIHARVAQAIETLFCSRLEEFYSLLAHHYVRAKIWPKAQEYLMKAGDVAGSISADAEALANYQQALDTYQKLFKDRCERLEMASLYRKIGEAFLRRGEHNQAIEYLQQALTHLEKSLPATQWRVRLAIFKEILLQITHRLFQSLFIKPNNEAQSPKFMEESRLYEALLWIYFTINQERFLLTALKLLNNSERHEFPYGCVLGYATFGLIFTFNAKTWLAERYHRRALKLAELTKNPKVSGRAYLCKIVHEYHKGNWNATLNYSKLAADIYRESGDLRGWGIALNITAYALAYQGDFEQALTPCHELIHAGQEAADKELCCWGLYPLGFVKRRMGHLNEAITFLHQAMSISESIPDYTFYVLAGGELGQCYLCLGNFQLALETLNKTKQISMERKIIGNPITPLINGTSEAYLLFVEQSAGDKRKASFWLKKARIACKISVKHGKVFQPAFPEAMLLKGRYEWLSGRISIARKWWQRSLIMAEDMNQKFDLGMTHFEIGLRLGEQSNLERAAVVFLEIGAHAYLAETQELLRRIESLD